MNPTEPDTTLESISQRVVFSYRRQVPAFAPVLPEHLSPSEGGVSAWRVQYQGQRAIKATPFFEFDYDERRRCPLSTQVKCASANRLVPLLADQPPFLQEDFYRHASTCGGATCGWCKTRKGMGPSVLKHAGDRKTICWYMRRRFAEVDGEAIRLVRQYALLHERLAAG
jgi:hypothetical protein